MATQASIERRKRVPVPILTLVAVIALVAGVVIGVQALRSATNAGGAAAPVPPPAVHQTDRGYNNPGYPTNVGTDRGYNNPGYPNPVYPGSIPVSPGAVPVPGCTVQLDLWVYVP